MPYHIAGKLAGTSMPKSPMSAVQGILGEAPVQVSRRPASTVSTGGEGFRLAH